MAVCPRVSAPRELKSCGAKAAGLEEFKQRLQPQVQQDQIELVSKK